MSSNSSSNLLSNRTSSRVISTISEPPSHLRRLDRSAKRVLSSNLIVTNAETVSDELLALAEEAVTNPTLIKKLVGMLTEHQICFSYDTEIVDRLSGVGDDWDVTLARIFVNSLAKQHIQLLQKLVGVVRSANNSSVAREVASFLLPAFFSAKATQAHIMLDLLVARYDDIFVNTTFDPVYQLDDLNVKPVLFGASPRSLITMFFLPQHPEPNYPHRLAIYLCVSLEPRQICQELRAALDGEKMTKKLQVFVKTLLCHMLQYRPTLPLADFLYDITPLPTDTEIEKPLPPRYLNQTPFTGEIVIHNPKILKTKKDGDLRDVKSTIFAEQLTLFDFELLKELNLAECIGDKEKPTIDKYCSIIDNFGCWVKQVISQNEGGKAVKVMQHFIKVAYECMRINSFNMSYTIYVSVSHFSLTSVLAKVSHTISKKYETLRRLYDITRNFTVYRNTFSLASSPKIPILPLWLGDLIHTHSAFSDEDKLCRVDILRSIANIILTIKNLQKVPVPYDNLVVKELSLLCSVTYD